MKKIRVSWIDAKFRDHFFEMEVPEKQSNLNIDHLVMDEIFDQAIDHYDWEEIGDQSDEI